MADSLWHIVGTIRYRPAGARRLRATFDDTQESALSLSKWRSASGRVFLAACGYIPKGFLNIRKTSSLRSLLTFADSSDISSPLRIDWITQLCCSGITIEYHRRSGKTAMFGEAVQAPKHMNGTTLNVCCPPNAVRILPRSSADPLV